MNITSIPSPLPDDGIILPEYSTIAERNDPVQLCCKRKAISKLNLKQGDSVMDIGCGTGLNFPFLYQAVGQEGKIIGVDLSGEMLADLFQIFNC